MARISRQQLLLASVVIDQTIGDSTEIDMREFAGGSVHILTGALTIMTYHSAVQSAADGGTYTAMHDRNGSPITQIVAGGGTMVSKTYPLPDEVFGTAFIKIVATTADATAEITLKG